MMFTFTVIFVLIFVLAASSTALQLDSRRTALSKVIGAVPAVTKVPSVALADSVTPTTSVALNSGSRFPLASFGLQVYDDSTGTLRGGSMARFD